MSDLARKTGLARPALYRALSPDGNPELATILKVAEALGFRLAPRRIAEGL
jgi:probable addiction module antidote protein